MEIENCVQTWARLFTFLAEFNILGKGMHPTILPLAIEYCRADWDF